MATPNLTAGVTGLAYGDRARRRWARLPTDSAEIERIARTLAAAGLIMLMAVGSVAVWTAIPLAGLWLVSQLSDNYIQLSVGPVIAAAVGIPTAMVFGVKGLAWLGRLYERFTGKPRGAFVVPAWRRSIRDTPSNPPASVLEKLMVANVLMAASVLVIWFFAVAGPSLPA